MSKTVSPSELVSLINCREVGEYRSTCPAHGGDNPTALRVTIPGDGDFPFKANCFTHKCSLRDIRHAFADLGANLNGHAKDEKKPVPLPTDGTRYPYHYENGKEACVVHRKDTPDGKKKITQWTPAGGGLYKPKGLTKDRPLYRLHKLDFDKPILIVEGEKCAHAFLKVSHKGKANITTWAGGTGTVHLTDWKPLAGKQVYLCSDGDETGREAMKRIGHILKEMKATVKILLAEGDDGNDIADWIKDGKTWKDIKDGFNDFDDINYVKPFARKNSKALAGALKLEGIEVRFNVRLVTREVKIDGTWTNPTKRFMGRYREDIAETYTYTRSDGKEAPLKYSADLFNELIDAITFDKEYDPFILKLESLPAWDQSRRLDIHQAELFGSNGTELDEWCSRYPFLGAVQRAYEPGSFIKEIPVLHAPQTFGKSPYLREMFWKDTEFFSDGFSFKLDMKRQVEALQGKVLVELAEMSGAFDMDQQAEVKAFLSRPTDYIRLSYRQDPEPMARRSIIVGTTDRVQNPIPNDPSGNSRYVVTKWKEKPGWRKLKAYMDKNRDQLWAEALYEYHEGSRANLPEELREAQEARNSTL